MCVWMMLSQEDAITRFRAAVVYTDEFGLF